MKNKIFTLLFVFFLIPSVVLAYSPTQKKKIKITATTSNLATLVSEICKDKVDVITIIPATSCPSTYDIDAGTIKEVSKSNIILYHSWQRAWVKDLKYKISNLGIVYRQLKTEGNLMIPYINLMAAEEFLELISVWDQDNKDFYEKNFLDYSFKINFISEQATKNNSNRHNKKIVCQTKLASFLEWLGFNVVMVYGKPSTLSSADLAKISKRIKENKVKYIVDNLQVGTEIGRSLSTDLKIKEIVISNFALGNSYINTLKSNIEKIDKALE